MIKVTSASDYDRFQCYFNNKGYYKYRDQCHYQHFYETCLKSVCRYVECPFRHPKICKNGGKCRFLNNYAYEHSNQIKKINNEEKTFNEKVKYWENKIKILEEEIIDLKTVQKIKRKSLKD